ncbi:hypothetical protein, partial [Staphylococcus aureus]|uniref:hypothetical protein n=1 Tax=Staphylococcus aureus TaxID=1280 RepID=UPI001F27B51A
MPEMTETPASGLIADNIVGFARALRAAGIPVGPGAVIDVVNALRLQALDDYRAATGGPGTLQGPAGAFPRPRPLFPTGPAAPPPPPPPLC